MAKHSLWYRVVNKLYKKTKQQSERLKWKRKAVESDDNVKTRVKLIGGGLQYSNQKYRDVILRYWRKYGVRPKKVWYSLYCNGMDNLDPRFIPDSIWYQNVLPHFNNYNMNKAYTDKGMYNRIFPEIRKPETIVKNLGGYFYDGDGEHLISRNEAEALCVEEEHLILKPSFGEKGKSILFYDCEINSPEDLSKHFDDLKVNFVVQRIVKQHPDLARLNPMSLNTVRVMTFHFKGEFHALSAQLRIGGAGARVDNVSSGGNACAIKPDGWLYEKSVTRKSNWADETPSGFKYKDIQVPSFDRIVDTVKHMHSKLPYFGIIGWDIAVGEDGVPVFIELNTAPEQNQIGGRAPTFGELTEEVLEEVFIKKTLK